MDWIKLLGNLYKTFVKKEGCDSNNNTKEIDPTEKEGLEDILVKKGSANYSEVLEYFIMQGGKLDAFERLYNGEIFVLETGAFKIKKDYGVNAKDFIIAPQLTKFFSKRLVDFLNKTNKDGGSIIEKYYRDYRGHTGRHLSDLVNGAMDMIYGKFFNDDPFENVGHNIVMMVEDCGKGDKPIFYLEGLSFENSELQKKYKAAQEDFLRLEEICKLPVSKRLKKHIAKKYNLESEGVEDIFDAYFKDNQVESNNWYGIKVLDSIIKDNISKNFKIKDLYDYLVEEYDLIKKFKKSYMEVASECMRNDNKKRKSRQLGRDDIASVGTTNQYFLELQKRYENLLHKLRSSESLIDKYLFFERNSDLLKRELPHELLNAPHYYSSPKIHEKELIKMVYERNFQNN